MINDGVTVAAGGGALASAIEAKDAYYGGRSLQGIYYMLDSGNSLNSAYQYSNP